MVEVSQRQVRRRAPAIERDAEVGDDDAALRRDEHVLGLEVAVADARRRGRDAIAAASCSAMSTARGTGSWPSRAQDLAQGDPVDVLEHEIRPRPVLAQVERVLDAPDGRACRTISISRRNRSNAPTSPISASWGTLMTTRRPSGSSREVDVAERAVTDRLDDREPVERSPAQVPAHDGPPVGSSAPREPPAAAGHASAAAAEVESRAARSRSHYRRRPRSARARTRSRDARAEVPRQGVARPPSW